jgi:uncharacterized RDD family membrane protein YckC
MENIQQPPPIDEPVKYAGFGKRFAAMMIDRVIIAFFCSSVYWELQKVLTWYIKRLSRKKDLQDLDLGFSGSYEKIEAMTMNYYIIFMIIAVWCYYAGMESSPWKGTVGKKLLGLEVSDEDGNRVSFTKATGRYFGKILSGVVFYIGYLVMLGNPKKQTWHDSMSGCVVKEK